MPWEANQDYCHECDSYTWIDENGIECDDEQCTIEHECDGEIEEKE